MTGLPSIARDCRRVEGEIRLLYVFYSLLPTPYSLFPIPPSGLNSLAMPPPRIAIPEPTSTDPAYNSRALPQYIQALHSAGATATVIPLTERPDRVARLLASVQGVLLPGG